jgi:hypothetical protein
MLHNGLILNPSNDLKIDCHPDADFAGLCNRDDKNDLHCICSPTGYFICLLDCPVLWISKLQTKIALSTMEAEYVALSALCCYLFPLIDIAKHICSALSLNLPDKTHMHIIIHKDNVGTLLFGQLEPRRMTPRSKHYAIKYHWFCEHLVPCKIQLVKIDTKNQLGDVFTTLLEKIAFQCLQQMLMGWLFHYLF